MPPVPRLQITDRRAAAERRRRLRRQGQLRLAGLIVVVTVVVLIVTDTAGGNSPRTRGGTEPIVPRDPLTTRAMTRLLSRRDGQVSIAVEDLRTGTEWTLRANERDQTASIVKANILEALLYQDRDDLDDAETETAQQMIEASDNDDASDLWDDIGGAPGLDAYDDKIGMAETGAGAGGYWGETLTTAGDQIKLLRQLALPKASMLSSAAVRYELSLMENIDAGENWGVTGGVPSSGVTVALKNGWVPLTSDTDWEVNSIGWIDGDEHDYLVAVLTAHDSSENDGIDTIDAVSKLIYDGLGPAPSAGTPTITVTPTG